MASTIAFKQIEKFAYRITRQTNIRHLNWSKTFRDRVESEIITPLDDSCPALISNAFSSYDTAVNCEDQVAIVIQRSEKTEELEQADSVRDNTWLGIKTMAESLQRIGTAEQKAAAKRFLSSADTHNIGISQRYEDETEHLRQFIQQCEGSLATDVETLGLTSLIAQLKTENEAVHQIIVERNTEASAADPTAMQTARTDVDDLYKQLVMIINAFAIAEWEQGQSPYDTAIDRINADIDYYDKHVFQKESKKKDDGQGGGGEGSSDSDDQGDDSGDQGGGGGDQTQGYALTISTSGTGSATVTSNGSSISSGTALAEDAEVEIGITPAAGNTPTASVNGSDIELSESGGVYTGNFAMPGQASTLVINTGTSGNNSSPDGLDKD